ncbi:carbamoyltransferase family protein [Salinactinospora qingdaonensis]|uniref:Carbamoyltransferase C-terminal domain-containing protein n=1 Tax=Salinactinospora qingdaonensis TaxID=702744 RepID=A0ABP7FCZ5_9ACTN
MTRYVLGVNIGFHDSSAALLGDGALRWLVEQERVSRRKHALAQPPVEAVRACLDAEGIGPESLEAIAVGWDFSGTPLAGNRRFTDEGMRTLLFGTDAPETMPPIRWIPHHLAHAASTCYVNGEPEAAVLVMDGAGETQSTSVGVARDGEIKLLREWPVSQSLGFFYTAASKWAGFGDWGTGKLMGLAAYGRPQGGMPVRRTGEGYEISVDGAPLSIEGPSGRRAAMGPLMAYFPGFEAAVRPSFCGHFPYQERQGEEPIAYADFAASAQEALEEAVLGLVADLREQHDVPALAVAGGVAMNCTMIGRLVRESPFERVYVPPVPTDAGVSLGAALVVAREAGRFAPQPLDHAYWSTPIGADEAAAAASAEGLVVRRLDGDELARVTARSLADGKIVAWARGRGEVGQRALGTRSILADPRNRRNLERLNLIKGREMWRPVAPSVLGERIDDLMATPVGEPARFMLAAGTVRGELRRSVPAVTHVDGSARPQYVDRATNPGYWSMIEEFRHVAGVPLVVNTSLNLAGEPIVHSAADAVSTFVRGSDLDLLVLDDLVVARSETELPEP